MQITFIGLLWVKVTIFNLSLSRRVLHEQRTLFSLLLGDLGADDWERKWYLCRDGLEACARRDVSAARKEERVLGKAVAMCEAGARASLGPWYLLGSCSPSTGPVCG